MLKNAIKKVFGIVLALILSFSLFGIPLAVGLTPAEKGEVFDIKNLRAGDKPDEHEMSYFSGDKGTPVAKFIIQIVDFLSRIIGTVAILMIIIGGLIWITGGGNENQVSKGKDTIVYAIIGLVVAFSAYILTAFVQSVFYPVEESAEGAGEAALILLNLV